MDSMLFIVLLMILLFVGTKNITLIKRFKQNKKYIDCYEAILNDKEDAYDHVNEFIQTEKTQEFKNKGKVLKLYYEMWKDIDYKSTLEDIDLKSIFCKKDKIDNNLVNLNSDTFVFIILAMGKANVKNNSEVIDTLVDKLNEISGLEQHLEYQEIIAYTKALQNKDDKGNAIMNSLLDGTYTEYIYEKNMIGLYKRIAAAILDYNEQPFDEFFKEDLYNFAKSIIGESILKDLGLYEKYKLVEEAKEEEPEEVIEEVQEENKE